MTDRIGRLIEKAGCAATAAVLLRYGALNTGSQQWSLPQSHYNYLYTMHGVRNEGFASPLNSRLMGKTNARFGSLFLDTDAPFGSIGPFFEINLLEHPGNWVVNPPYSEDLLEQSAQYTLDAATKANQTGKSFLAFYIMPAWTDTKAYMLLTHSSHVSAELRLPRQKYAYETPDGIPITAMFDSIYFALTNNGQDPGGSLAMALRTMLLPFRKR